MTPMPWGCAMSRYSTQPFTIAHGASNLHCAIFVRHSQPRGSDALGRERVRFPSPKNDAPVGK